MTIFPHPFSKAFWKTSAMELKNTRMLVFAALMIALRVIFKAVSIPIGPDLRINVAFLINAFGAMVYGPVIAIIAAAVTDTLGCLLFPTGPYFFPFIFQEIAGSLIFALFLYRQNLTPKRVILSRFCIDFFVNIVLTTPIMMLYYEVMLGKYYAPFDLLRIIKNLVLFPFESIILMVFLSLAVPRVRSLHFVVGSADELKFTRKMVPSLIAFFLAGAVSVAAFSWYSYEHTSLSASFTSQERSQKNHEMLSLIAAHTDLNSEPVLTVIESAYPSLLSGKVRYTVQVYRILEETIKERSDSLQDELSKIWAYSRTPASKDSALEYVGRAYFTLDQTGSLTEYSDDFSDSAVSP